VVSLSNLYPLSGAKGGDPMSFLKRLLRRDTPVSSADLESVSDSVQSAQTAELQQPQLPTIKQVCAAAEAKYSATQIEQS
jgi:hypothetical protein